MREAAEERHIDALRGALASSADFEKQLTDDGYVVVKFFVHVTKEAQRKRLTRLRRDPTTAWRVSDGKMATIGEYEEAYRLYDNLLEGSDFSYAPWHLINGEDKRRANLKITETLVDALDKALHAKKDPAVLRRPRRRRPTAPVRPRRFRWRAVPRAAACRGASRR